ncbi:DUF4411 family protein [Carnobacterium maltaromaticum]|uniref:DUF4411 family protein n=1 Tax=Carnobacterium maltaromaticum TaxID=2751 RepID=UPI00165C25FC|nr:DUF4411 family protein [Carnobacterium maltaromaticum]MBC9787160.1 DUF4411 family protein [Carnobacterium maltaromaticum]
MTKYLLDSNIYINFYDRYYQHSYFPSFWENLKEIMNQNVLIPKVVIDEHYQDQWFTQWLSENFEHEIINHNNYAEEWVQILDHVSTCGFYSDAALSSSKGWANVRIADPWIIAIAKSDDLVIVTSELKNKNLNANQPSKAAKIPDICNSLGIRCIDMNTFFKEMNLSI